MKNEIFTKGKKIFIGIEVAEWIEFLMLVQALENSATNLVDHVSENLSDNDDIKSILLVNGCLEVLNDFSGLRKYMSKYVGALSEDLEAANKNKEE
jgi:hypothetical protein